MKSINLFLSVIMMSLIFSGSSCKSGGESTSNQNYISRNYKVSEFSGIDVSTVGNIYFTQSTDGKTSLEIYAPESILEKIEVSIKNNTLFLTIKKNSRINNIKRMNINISAPELNHFAHNGVGNVNIADLTSNSLTIGLHGVGNMNITSLKCNDISVNTTGVGDLYLSGKTIRATLNAEGVGSINAMGLESRDVNAASTGVGNISCFATESISATANGVGKIKYKGTPQEKRIRKDGVGSIKQVQ